MAGTGPYLWKKKTRNRKDRGRRNLRTYDGWFPRSIQVHNIISS